MADPLSIASGIAGLVTLAELVIERTYTTIKICKNAGKDASRLLIEVQALMGVLKGLTVLEIQVERSVFEAKIVPARQYQCQKMLEELRDKLDHGNPCHTTSKVRKLERVLKWPMTASEVEDKVNEIERFKTEFNLAVSMETLKAVLAASSQQTSLIEDVKHIKESLCRIEMNQERRDILDFFHTYISESNHQTSRRLREPLTGQWLIDSPEMRTWIAQRNSKLWLYGIPGAGKTVLAGAVVDEALKLATPLVGVAYFYCDYKSGLSRDLRNILASLAGQLATQSKPCFEALRKLYYPQYEENPIRNIPEADQMKELLIKFMIHFVEIVIVVDALDECDDAREVAQTLGALADRANSNMKLVALSRDEVDIRHHLSSFAPLSIAAKSSDLRLFVSNQLEERTKSRKLRIKSPQLKDEILDRLVNQADGMFRWVACQMDHLCDLPTDADRRKALQTLPPDLDTTYTRILERINKQGFPTQKLVQRVLFWLIDDDYGIDAEQLCEAVSIEVGQENFDPESLLDAQEIALRCSSLVRFSPDQTHLQIAHFTVEEYLRYSISETDDSLAPYRVSSEHWNRYKAQTSITFLSMDTSIRRISDKDDFTNRRQSFASIASLWPEFVGRSLDNDTLALAKMLFTRGDALTKWIQYYVTDMIHMFDTLRDRDVHAARDIARAGVLPIACVLNIPDIATALIDDGYDVNQDCMLGTPLHLAMLGEDIVWYHSGRGHYRKGKQEREKRESLVRLLLEDGAATDQRYECDEHGSHSAFEIAFDKGFWSLFLDASILPDSRFLTRLVDSDKLDKDVSDLVQRLRATSVPEELRTPLSRLAMRTEMMPRRAVDPASQASETLDLAGLSDLLVAACKQDDVIVVEHLIETYGLTSQIFNDITGQTQIGLALDNEAFRTVEYLLENDATLLDTSFGGESIWHIIVATGDEGLFETLVDATLDRGISLEAAASTEDMKGRKPVHIAALRSPKILEAMHRHGLSIDVQSLDGRSTFHYAAQAVFEKGPESLKLLSTMVVPSDIPAQDGSTVAHDIFKNSPTGLPYRYQSLNSLAVGLEVLRSNGADMVRCMADGSNILHSLCKLFSEIYICSSESVRACIETVLAAGVKPNSKDADGACPLDLLIAHCDDDYGRPPDHMEAAMVALARVQPEIELLDHLCGMSLLEWAAKQGMDSLCEVLLDRGGGADEYSSFGYNLTLCDDSQHLSFIQVLAWRACPVALKSAMEKTKALMGFGRHGYNLLHLVAGTPVLDDDRVFASLSVLLDAGFDPNVPVRGHRRPTALMLAASQGHTSALRILLKHGADINIVDTLGWTSLDFACTKHSFETIDFLLPYIKSVQPCRSQCFIFDTELLLGPLEMAAWNRRIPIVLTMLYARLQYASAPTVSALWIACKRGSSSMASILIDDGADLDDVWTERGQSLLHAAAQDGSEDVISMLLSTGHDFRLLDSYGLPPSYYARVSKYTTILQRLEEWERSQAERTNVLVAANVTMSKSLAWQQGLTPIISRIIKDGDIKSLKRVLETVNDATAFDLPLPCGCTPFVLAVSLAKGGRLNDCPDDFERKIEVCDLLLSKGPCLTSSDGCWRHSENPLEAGAAIDELSSLLDLMIKSRSFPQSMLTSSSSGISGSLLHIAVKKGNRSAVSLLIEAGAFIDCVDPDLATPLHFAAGSRDARIVQLLLEAGANPNCRDCKLRTPAHWAAMKGATTTLLELAKDHRTDLGLYDDDIFLPIQRAARAGHLESVHALVIVGQEIDYAAVSRSARTLLLNQAGCLSYAMHGMSELTDPYALWGFPSCHLSVLRRTTRAYSRENLFKALNTPHLSSIWGYRDRPLYNAASTSELSIMETLIDSGGLVNLEGGPEGTALMAACAFGRLNSVKMLIRLGAIERYNKGEIVFSAITKARHHPEIIHWLLVGRHTDQQKLTSSAHEPNANVLYNISPDQESIPPSKRKALNLDLVLEEDWDSYLAKLQPRSTRSFVCQIYERECIIHEVAAGANLAKRSPARVLRRQSF